MNNTPSLGIDLDGTIDEAPIFFNILSNAWPGKVFIITYRNDYEKAKNRVEEFGVKYDEIILVSSFSEKAKVIKEKGILSYFDDQDEMTQDIPEGVNVFKIRNGGNFDFDAKKWLYSSETGKSV